MPKYIYRWGAPLALVTLLAAACTDSKSEDTLAQDTSLTRDLEMANQDTVSQPALQDVPALESPSAVATNPAPAPSRSTGTTVRTPTRPRPAPAPAPAPAPSAPRTTPSGNTETKGPSGSERALGSIPAGAELSLASNSRICTNTHRVGQRFSANVSNAVVGSNGAVIPAGATATVEITELKRSENVNDEIRVGLRVVSVTFGGRTYPLDATTTSANVDRVRNQPKQKDVQKVVGGAAIGAIIGQVLGKDTKSTVIGAATGAAAGTAAAATTANYEGCVPSGGRITARLDSSAQIQV